MYYQLVMKKFSSIPRLKSNVFAFSPNNLCLKKANSIDDLQVIPILNDPNVVFYSILLTGFLWVRVQVKELICSCEPFLITKQIDVIDVQDERVETYFIIIMDEIENVALESITKSSAKHLFRVANTLPPTIVVSEKLKGALSDYSDIIDFIELDVK